jgi:hypothetical protein
MMETGYLVVASLSHPLQSLRSLCNERPSECAHQATETITNRQEFRTRIHLAQNRLRRIVRLFTSANLFFVVASSTNAAESRAARRGSGGPNESPRDDSGARITQVIGALSSPSPSANLAGTVRHVSGPHERALPSFISRRRDPTIAVRWRFVAEFVRIQFFDDAKR